MPRRYSHRRAPPSHARCSYRVNRAVPLAQSLGSSVSSAAVVSKSLSMWTETAESSCMQKARRTRHQHGVQRAARATSRARRPRISPSSLAHSGDVLEQRRPLGESSRGVLPGRASSSHVARRRRWLGPGAAGLLPNTAAKFGVGGSSGSRALAKQDDEAPLRRNGASAVSESFWTNADD